MSFIANLFGYVLNYIYNLIPNYGYAIIIFTILLKLILLPMTYKQQKNMKKQSELQDELNKLQIKFKNNPEMLQQETMQLYKREKISPFSGCLSSIVQLVIFLAVFYMVSSPLTYMKKIDKTKIENYKQTISEQGESSSYPEIKIIEKYSSEDPDVSLNMNFLNLDLSKVPMQNAKDIKVFIIPALYVIITFVNIKISNNLTNKKKDEKDKLITDGKKVEKDDDKESAEEQMENMQQMTKSMNYMMPIMSVAIALIAPLGLSLYWLVSNILQLGERLVINKISEKAEKKA